MSKYTNDGLTSSGTGCFIAVPIWQQWASLKGLIGNPMTEQQGVTLDHTIFLCGRLIEFQPY